MLAADHGIAEVEVIGMGTRKAIDGDFAGCGAPLRRVRKASERLQNGECAQLQRIELARVLSDRHGARCDMKDVRRRETGQAQAFAGTRARRRSNAVSCSPRTSAHSASIG